MPALPNSVVKCQSFPSMYLVQLFVKMVLLRMGTSLCLEYPVIGKLDCSKENLNSVPYNKVIMWVKNADFAYNNFTAINIMKLLIVSKCYVNRLEAQPCQMPRPW